MTIKSDKIDSKTWKNVVINSWCRGLTAEETVTVLEVFGIKAKESLIQEMYDMMQCVADNDITSIH